MNNLLHTKREIIPTDIRRIVRTIENSCQPDGIIGLFS